MFALARVIIEYPSGDGTVRVEAEDYRGQGPVAVGRGGKIVSAASESFEEALAGIRPIAEGIIAQTAGLVSAPRKVEATFGITLSGEVGAILAKTAAEANIEIKLTWESEAGN